MDAEDGQSLRTLVIYTAQKNKARIRKVLWFAGNTVGNEVARAFFATNNGPIVACSEPMVVSNRRNIQLEMTRLVKCRCDRTIVNVANRSSNARH